MPQCAFKHCVNTHRNSKVSEGVSFFRFPTDPFRCAEWISIIAKEREDMYRPAKHATVCSIHFDECDITGNSQRRRLLKTSVPKLQIRVKQEVKSDPELTMPKLKPQKAAKPIKTSLPDPLDSDDSDQSSAITDEETSPNKFILRKVEKILADKKRLLQVNQNLKRRNKRLAVKCKQYREILVTLKDKISFLESKVAEKDSG